jgi:hypothetical protein
MKDKIPDNVKYQNTQEARIEALKKENAEYEIEHEKYRVLIEEANVSLVMGRKELRIRKKMAEPAVMRAKRIKELEAQVIELTAIKDAAEQVLATRLGVDDPDSPDTYVQKEELLDLAKLLASYTGRPIVVASQLSEPTSIKATWDALADQVIPKSQRLSRGKDQA